MNETSIRRKARMGKTIFYVVAIIMAVIVCLPFFWMLITSLKNRGAVMSIPVEWIPKNPTLEAYTKLFAIPNFGSAVLNSFYLAVVCSAVRLLCAAMAAYALTKIRYRGRDGIFKVYLTALMIPAQITFIPLFLVMTKLRLTNSLNAFLMLQLFHAFSIFMLRQKMMTINNAYIEAATIDGASHWRIFWHIMMPMCSGTLATLAIISFIEVWNDFLLPLVLLTERSKYTLPILLSTLSGEYKNQYALMMAGSLVSIVPILLVYIGAQRYFKEGLGVGGVKG